MLDDDLSVKISDFGLSKNLYEKNYYKKIGQGYIPWKWMSPEVLEKGMVSVRSDVWSFGIVNWELFSRGKKKTIFNHLFLFYNLISKNYIKFRC